MAQMIDFQGHFNRVGHGTPFAGWTLRGGVAATIVGGRVLYVNPDVAGASTLAG